MASILNRVPLPTRSRRNRSDAPAPSQDPYTPPVPTEEEFVEMTLAEHLEELRSRILKSAIAVLIALIAGLAFAMQVIEKVAEQAKVPQDQLQIISPTESFTVFMRVALYIAVAIAMPVLIYQLLAFVSPGLTYRERRYIFLAVPFVVLSFAAGVAFAFFLLAPRALEFLSTFGGDIFEWNPRAADVVQFYMTLMLGVGLIFELPILMYALTLIGVMTAKRYGRFRKFAIILSMVAAAIITPTPDPFNMALVAIPTYVLYELGILLSRTVRRSSREAA